MVTSSGLQAPLLSVGCPRRWEPAPEPDHPLIAGGWFRRDENLGKA